MSSEPQGQPEEIQKEEVNDNAENEKLLKKILEDNEEKEPFSLRSFIQELAKQCKEEMEQTKDVEERIKIICSKESSMQIGELVHEEGAWPRKDEELSRTNREDGNRAYNEGRYEMAILLYTEAMRYAPCNPVLLEGEALASAAANRSAAFYQTKQYLHAIDDIEVAISAGYPKNCQYKLYIRMCKCELELNRIGRAQRAFDLAVEAIEWSGLKKDIRSDLTVNLQEAFINLAKEVEEDGNIELEKEATLEESEFESIPSKFWVADTHKQMPAASSSVKVKFNDKTGRHVVATNRIQAGDIVFMERPIVSTVCDEHFENICIVCLRYTTAPLPCPTCSDANFCSLRCQKEGLSTFHKYECKLTHVFQQTEKFLSPRSKFGCNEEEYQSQDYATLFNLCTHSNLRENFDVVTKTVFACFLLRCLQETGYFKTKASLTITDEEAFIGRLLKHFIECIQFNTHTIESIYENRVVGWDAETRLWKSSTRCNIGDSVETERIGGGVYPTMALVNHSCDPNIVLIFFGRVALAVASRAIEPGEEINDNYGANYASMPVKERKPFLEKSHWFTCTCKACTSNYPVYMKCPKDYKKIPGSAFKFPRVDRQKLNRDVEMIKKEIKGNVLQGNLEKVYESFVYWSDLVDQLVYPPHQDFINIRKGIRNCMFQLSPNKCRARESKEEDER